jgi:FixJ family two-component response regulator
MVFIVDDDEAVCDSLSLLLDSMGLETQVFHSAQAFLAGHDGRPGCLLLDVRMPGLSGMDLQKRLSDMGKSLPIVFISGHGDIPMAVEAMKAGAIDFLQKPFRDQELLDCVQKALASLDQTMAEQQALVQANACFNSLTPREREVLNYLVDGAANKVIAIDLNISPRTVEIHRARVMEKMQVKSLPELVKVVLQLRQAASKSDTSS